MKGCENSSMHHLSKVGLPADSHNLSTAGERIRKTRSDTSCMQPSPANCLLFGDHTQPQVEPCAVKHVSLTNAVQEPFFFFFCKSKVISSSYPFCFPVTQTNCQQSPNKQRYPSFRVFAAACWFKRLLSSYRGHARGEVSVAAWSWRIAVNIFFCIAF